MSIEIQNSDDGTLWRRRLFVKSLGAFGALGFGFGLTSSEAAASGSRTENARGGRSGTSSDDGRRFAAVVQDILRTPEATRRFGESVAVDGRVVLVGSPPGTDAEMGTAFVFERAGTAWFESPPLTPEDDAGREFGAAVDVRGDTAVVCAPGDDEVGPDAGAVYVFGRERTQKLTPETGSETFGDAVSLAEDVLVVGGGRAGDDETDSGAAYVFERDDGTWTRVATLTADDAGADAGFGESVVADVNTVFVGAPNDGEAGPGGGAAYVFERDEGTWRRAAKLVASDTDEDDRFGTSLSLDGETALVGAPGDEDEDGVTSGSVIVFTRSGGSWTESAQLVSPTPADGDEFGSDAAIGGDTAVVGAPGDLDREGSVFVFVRDGDWELVTTFTGDRAGERGSFATSLDFDGVTAAVGSPADPDGGAIPSVELFASAYARETISQAKYGLPFAALSVETTGQVQTIYNRQPFPRGVEPGQIRTREQLAENLFGEEFEESELAQRLSKAQLVDVQNRYDEQFGPLPEFAEYPLDFISRQKYGLPFAALSVETTGQVQALYNRQPFPADFEPEQIRTREQIAEDLFGENFEEGELAQRLSKAQLVEVQDNYDGQFGRLPRPVDRTTPAKSE